MRLPWGPSGPARAPRAAGGRPPPSPIPSPTSRQAQPGPVLVVCAEARLLELVSRVCAGAQLSPRVVTDEAQVRALWLTAVAVLVGADLAGVVASWRLDARGEVLLVTDDPGIEEVGTAVWRAAVELHVDEIVWLPAAEGRLSSRLADAADGAQSATTIGVIAGSGGAGASTLAGALALRAARTGASALLVDADPAGGGLELTVGSERRDGLRWGDLAAAGDDLRGRVRGTALRSGLPTVDGLAVLSWRRDDIRPLPPGTTRAIIGPARRGCDVVVVDLPRILGSAAVEAVDCCHVLLLVVTPGVRSVAAAQTVLGALDPWRARVRLVVRRQRGALLAPDLLAATLALPLAAVVPTRRSVPRALDEGLGPLGGRGIGRACDAILAAADRLGR